jgi:hypothetical protein
MLDCVRHYIFMEGDGSLSGKVKTFNERVAQAVSQATGNMWFFWGALLFILLLRITHPPKMRELLLNVENDLQLLLLAANAVVGAKQLSVLLRLLKHIEAEERAIKDKIGEEGQDNG